MESFEHLQMYIAGSVKAYRINAVESYIPFNHFLFGCVDLSCFYLSAKIENNPFIAKLKLFYNNLVNEYPSRFTHSRMPCRDAMFHKCFDLYKTCCGWLQIKYVVVDYVRVFVGE